MRKGVWVMMIIIALLIGVLVYYLVTGKDNIQFGDKNEKKKSPVEVLKNRYANGEIDEETYRRMLTVLER